MNKNIRTNILWNTSGSIFYCICQWLITIIVVRVASYEDAGYLSLAMTTSSSFSAIALFSMRNFQISDVAGEYSCSMYVGSRIITSIFAFICCCIASLFFNTPYQTMCIAAFMLIRVSEAIVDVLHAIDQKYDHYDYIGISYILRGIVTVVFFLLGLGLINDLLVTLLVIAILNLIVALLFDWKKTYSLDCFGLTIFNKKVFELLRKCVPIVIYTFLRSLENLIPKTILQLECGAESLGIYSSMASPTLVVQVFASVAFNPLLPQFSEVIYKGDKRAFKNLLHKTYFFLVVMSIVVTIGASLCGRFGLSLLFGNDILEYYSLFMPIIWCTILTAIVWILSAILVALRRIKWLLIGMIVDFLICLVLARYLIQNIGMNGVSIVQIIAFAIYIVFMIIVCEIPICHRLPINTKD